MDRKCQVQAKRVCGRKGSILEVEMKVNITDSRDKVPLHGRAETCQAHEPRFRMFPEDTRHGNGCMPCFRNYSRDIEYDPCFNHPLLSSAEITQANRWRECSGGEPDRCE